jgi:two-component system sensor histidine kinase RegB
MISAAALPPAWTVALGGLAMLAASGLAVVYQPLPWASGESLGLPAVYRAAVWVAIVLGLAFVGVYAWRVTEEARQLAQALAATELVLAREQHLSQLDGLAAAAAHELGTPLATIAVITKELQKAIPPGGQSAEDVALLGEQVARCRSILAKLASLGQEEAGPLATMPLGVLIEEIAAPQRPFMRIDIELTGLGPQPIGRCNPAILYGLGNLMDNAVDFARTRTRICGRWDARKVEITITDDGPGFPPEILARLGEPYVTTRRSGGDEGRRAGGMGLGFFIAKALLERSGATLVMTNAPEGGACVSVVWSRLAFEREIGPLAKSLESAFPL